MEIEEYTTQSLEFIFNEAQKHFDDISHSFKEITNKSYLLTGIIISTISAASILKSLNWQNIILLMILLIPLLLIFRNLLPVEFIMNGAEPKMMQHEYFKREKKSQYDKYLIQRIGDLQEAITNNGAILDKRSLRLTYSVVATVISLLVSFVFWF